MGLGGVCVPDGWAYRVASGVAHTLARRWWIPMAKGVRGYLVIWGCLSHAYADAMSMRCHRDEAVAMWPSPCVCIQCSEPTLHIVSQCYKKWATVGAIICAFCFCNSQGESVHRGLGGGEGCGLLCSMLDAHWETANRSSWPNSYFVI